MLRLGQSIRKQVWTPRVTGDCQCHQCIGQELNDKTVAVLGGDCGAKRECPVENLYVNATSFNLEVRGIKTIIMLNHTSQNRT